MVKTFWWIQEFKVNIQRMREMCEYVMFSHVKVGTIYFSLA